MCPWPLSFLGSVSVVCCWFCVCFIFLCVSCVMFLVSSFCIIFLVSGLKAFPSLILFSLFFMFTTGLFLSFECVAHSRRVNIFLSLLGAANGLCYWSFIYTRLNSFSLLSSSYVVHYLAYSWVATVILFFDDTLAYLESTPASTRPRTI